MRPPLLDEEGDEMEIDLDDHDGEYGELDFNNYDRGFDDFVPDDELEEVIENALDSAEKDSPTVEDQASSDWHTLSLSEVYAPSPDDASTEADETIFGGSSNGDDGAEGE